MKFYKIVLTKELHREKWVEIDGEQKKVKSILVNSSTETSGIYASNTKAIIANRGKETSASKRKNKKIEIVGNKKWGVDEVLHITWKVQEVDIPKENIIKFSPSENMLVQENGKMFLVLADKELEK